MTDVENQSLEDQCRMMDVALTADRLEECHHQYYTFGDAFLKTEIEQLATHYHEITGLPYHHIWKQEYNGVHK